MLVRYKVKPGRAAENRSYIEKVFQELKANGPDGIRYASFILDDGVSFVHIASIERSDGRNPLSERLSRRSRLSDGLNGKHEAVTSRQSKRLLTLIRRGQPSGIPYRVSRI